MKKLKMLLLLCFAVSIVTAGYMMDPKGPKKSFQSSSDPKTNSAYKKAYYESRSVAERYLTALQNLLDTFEADMDLAFEIAEDIRYECQSSPPSVEHTFSVVIKVNDTQQVAVYTCEPGYTYAGGENKVRCDHDYGQWDEATFRCTECFINQFTYKGTKSKTEGGIECQRWDSQSPHSHNYTNPEVYPEKSITAAENYCRAIEKGFNEPWCFTVDPNLRWDYCGIPKCNRSLENDCGSPSLVTSINSNVTPRYSHTTYSARASYMCDTLSDPTQDEYCPVSVCTKYGWSAASISCGALDCVSSSKKYVGKRTCTVSGRTCQRWNSQYPHTHRFMNAAFPDGSADDAGNYCRDPNGYGTTWCYTIDPKVRWEVCDVPSCDKFL
ncbi:hypothetical protein ACJMK2_028880 [Sinanodonta woodiana]|uniref:Uncharacterized protein n=1 Tax=Sinanodonta woodiana TaxID=1069815 RepID=A0ABD3X8F6_SINWO